MKPVWWMVGASVASWLVAVAIVGPSTGTDVLLGMIGPLASASGTWVLVVRTYATKPSRLMPLMVLALGGKMVFFGAYVVVVMRALPLSPVPFVVSFTSYFIALHLTEALCLRRLLQSSV